MTKLKNNSLVEVNYDPFRDGEIESLIPTSAAQKEIWTSIKFEDDATLCYNETIEIQLNGIINSSILEYSINEIANRYIVLKANFSSDGNSLLITNSDKKIFKFTDYSNSFNSNDLVEKFKEELQKSPVNVERDALFHANLFKLGPESYKLILYAHHIVCDGWSYAIILNELGEIYSSLVKGKAPILNEVLSQKDFIEQNEKNSVIRNNSFKYWENNLKGFKKRSSFPTDFGRKKSRTFNSNRIDKKIEPKLIANFKKLCSKNGFSLYTGLISIYLILINKISKEKDIVVGLSSATQPTLDNNLLVGHFVNLLPLRVKIDSNVPALDFLKSNKKIMLDAFENQFITFGELVANLKLDRIPGEMPLISHVFNIDQQAKDQGINFVNAKASYKSVPRVYENFELFINAVSREDFLELECQYNKSLFNESTIQNWLNNYEELIELVVINSSVKIEDILLNNLKIPDEILLDRVDSSLEVLDNEKYELVKKIWKDLLFLDEVEKNDSFFKLGGHSLLAIEFINTLSQQYNITISMKDVFDHSSLVEMSNFISSLNKADAALNSLRLKKSNDSNNAFLTNAQMQIWYLEEIHKDTKMHNLPSAILLDEVVDFNKLNKTFLKLIDRHDSLRTVITKNKGRPIQKQISYEDAIELFKLDFKKADSLISLEKELLVESNQVFDKTKFPLFKATLYHLADGRSVIFFLVHHFIWDGWSFDIFFDELNKLYVDVNSNLPEIKYTYLDYANWLHESLADNKFKVSEEYWINKLSGELPVLNLPIDYKRPNELSHEGKAIYFNLENEDIVKLKKIAGDCNTSLFNLFICVYKIVLLDLARENTDYESIVVGMPVRSREFPELLSVIGYFVNTVAIKSEIDFTKTFADNLKHVSSNVSEALSHQQLPFQVVLNKINYDKDNGRNPIFQSFFSYQDVSNREALFNNKKYKQVNVDKNSVHTELDLWIKSSEFKTEGAFEFDISLFKDETIINLKNNFINILKKLISDGSNVILNNIPLDKNQMEKLLYGFNQTVYEFDKRPFFYLIDEIAKKFPNNHAIVDENKVITYSELKNKSDLLASIILKNKCKLVGISLNRNAEMLIGILGVLKAGKGYVPLDPNFPQDRLEYMISHSELDLLVTETSLNNKFKVKLDSILLDSIDFKSITPAHLPEVNSDQTAYVIYTSGSTGQPKGVELSHLSVSNFLQGMLKLDFCSCDDKLLAVTTLSFDIAVLELYLPLIVGAKVYIAKSTDVMDGNKLKNLISEQNITIMQATPTTWRLLLQSGFTHKNNLTILCGGESFPIDLVSKLAPKVKRILNMYGPTETTVWSSVKELKPDDDFITIGKPIINTTFYILDDHLRMVPQGGVGQLFIGGTGLAKGYLNRPDLTSERFIRNPHRNNEVIYATGDLAKYTYNGEVLCLGRNDGQVKVRGFRIELGEVENALIKNPLILECSCIVHDFGNGDKRIIAYYSTQNSIALLDSDIKGKMDKQLPNYMLPSHFVHLEKIPKTPNGKIDKKLLPKDRFKKEIKIVVDEKIKAVEDNDSSNQLLNIFKKVLNNNLVTQNDNFFDVGGNSIIAVELMVLVSEQYNKEVQLSQLLEAKNIKEFGEKILFENCSTQATERSVLVPNIEQVFKSLVTIKNSGLKNPIFCFHGVGGNVLNYISLLPALNQERPLYAFQSIGLDGESEPLTKIEEMALHYYRELKLLKPEGPYILAGGSMGGLIAFEVAKRLVSHGDTVEQLIMFDTFGPNFDLTKYSSKRKISFINKVCNSAKYRLKLLLNVLMVTFRRNLGLKIPIKTLLFEIEHKNYQAIWAYRPTAYNGNLTLVRSGIESSGWYSDPNLGWDGLIKGNIVKYYIDAEHAQFIESPELTKVLKKILK